MKFMYENLEGVYSELLMIDERARDPKKYKTIKLPSFLRIKMKERIIKKTLNKLDNHLEKKPLLSFDYMKDFTDFFARTYQDSGMYKLLPNKISVMRCISLYDGYIEIDLNTIFDNDVANDSKPLKITWYYGDKTVLVVYNVFNNRQDKIMTVDSFSTSRYGEQVYKHIRKYAGYYLRTIKDIDK